METFCISNPELSHFLKREVRLAAPSYDPDLRAIFCDILEQANQFLPSEAGSIFLDDPVVETEAGEDGELVLIACFGRLSENLVGLRLRSELGVAGHVYHNGQPYASSCPEQDPLFRQGLGPSLGFATNSMVCAPLEAEGRTIGVIELMNHRGGHGYSDRDLQLLGILAQTISASIVNAMDAERSREMAKLDDLTGLYNDRYLHHRLKGQIDEAVATGEDCGLLFLDLDHFKVVNDRHGHLIGSRVLREVGATLRQILPGQSLAARYGGDEFVIVVPGAGRQETFWVAETVRKNIESKTFLETADPEDPANYPALHIRGVITCSIGIANLASDVLTRLASHRLPDLLAIKNELMRTADTNMYRAKELGRNLTVSTPDEPVRGAGS